MKAVSHIKRTIGLIALFVMLSVIGVLGVRMIGLIDRTLEELKTTPTPVPAFGSVMQVTPDPNAPTPQPVLRVGSQGEEVWQVQERLSQLGYYKGAIDGQYGEGTQAAVKLFQQQHGLGADGVFGQQTREMLWSDQAHQVIVYTATPAPTATPVPTPTLEPRAADAFGGYPILVNRQYAVPAGYEPDDLVLMNTYCDASVVIIKEQNTWGQREAVDALMTMLRAAHRDGITVWQVSEGYRTVAKQQELFDEQVASYKKTNSLSHDAAVSATRQTVADPGNSEHHTGLAFDITVPGVYFRDTEQAKWLADNCWEYGFIIRYTEEKQPMTGYLAEPWHIRYVGREHALAMRDRDLCLEEYLAEAGVITLVEMPVTLQNGSRGALVSSLQSRLAELGYYTGAIDGDFGPGTEAAVKAFQAQNGLTPDGIAGAYTQQALDNPAAATAPPAR